MKYIVAILFHLTIYSCQKPKTSTYAEGLENCNQIQEEKKRENPNAFLFENPDCIIGSQIPDFDAITVEGKKINRESLKGKISIVNFWFTTCAPCVAEIPGFNSIVDKYGTNNMNYIAIGRDDNKDIKDFLHEHPWKFEHIPDGTDIIQNNFKLRWGFPTTFLLNKNAVIILAFSGGKTDSTAVAEIQKILVPAIEKELKG